MLGIQLFRCWLIVLGSESVRPRKVMAVEVGVLVGLAVGLSAARSVLSFARTLAEPVRVSAQSATLNRSVAPGHPWIDFGYQLVFVVGLLLPAALAVVLVLIRGESVAAVGLSRYPLRGDGLGDDLADDVADDLGGRQRIGRQRGRWLGGGWLPQVGLGVVVAVVVGGLGLAIYLASYAWGLSLAVVPTSLPDVWWRVPVLVLAAVANAVLEEVVLAGYLVHRLGQLGARPVVAVGVSAVIRGLYHLYQGAAGVLGNVIMGAVFAGYFHRGRTVVPQIVAHALIDVVAFVGYLALAGRVSWLPG